MLATVGDNCIDRYLPPIGVATVGGNAVNVAVHLGRRGHLVTYYGAIGGDEDGRRVVEEIARNGVATDRVRVIPDGRTATTDIQSGPDGARVIAVEDFGVCRGYRPDPGETAELRRMRHVHVGWLDDGGALRRALAGDGVAISQDLSVNTGPEHAGAAGLAIAFAAADGWDEADAVATRLLAAGARLAVVTCGAAGSMAADPRQRVRTGAAVIPVVDTLGAGDTFIAGFLDAFLTGQDLPACLAAGRDAAAATCRHFGGFPQRPWPLDREPVRHA